MRPLLGAVTSVPHGSDERVTIKAPKAPAEAVDVVAA
jgi:hypothetical protein